MGMKKHGSKKDALPVDSSKKEPQRITWKSKYEQIQSSHVTNGSEELDSKEEDETKTSALDGLSGYLSSEDSSSGESELNEEVQNFLKEVDDLYKEDQKKQQNSVKKPVETPPVSTVTVPTAKPEMAAVQYESTSAPTVAWQECYDSTTGYTYYWNMETNEVTWDMPAEYQSYMEALKQWQQYQAQGVAALLQARVQQQLHQQQQQQLLLQQAQAQQKLLKPDAKTPSGKGKKRPSVKQSDSEDEKIELITSYGPFSDEESSDTEKVKVKTPKAKKKKSEPKSSSPKPSMGPQLPPGGRKLIRRIERPKPKEKPLTNSLVPYHPDIDDSDTDDTLENSKLNFVPDNGPPGAEPEKLSTDVSSPKEEEEKKTEVESTVESKPNSKEDEEDEIALLDRLKSQTQVLKELGGEIPEEVKSIITENNEKEEINKSDEPKENKNLKLKLSARAKKLISASTTTAKARATDFVQTPDGLKPIQRNKENIVSEDSGSTKSEDQDKRKGLWQGLSPSLLSGESGKSEELRMREEGNRGGFGFIPSCDGKKRLKTDKINFVKADIFHLSEDDENKGNADEDEELTKEILEISEISGVLNDKMKFLSEGKESVPPVQIWMIQLETLLSAWENKCLKRNFLEDWLMRTSKELESLECSVAPDGWVCEWQRSEKRYQYRKVSTGETTWEFPASATGGGEEEMDLSTTPPPPPSTPPAPIISVPSPPSPPHISAPDPCPPPLPAIKSSPPLIPDEAPPLPGEIPPLPPLPPTPPPPPPTSPPAQPVHPSQPLPPGVDPPDLPPLPPPSSPEYPPLPPMTASSVPPPPPTIYPSQFYQPFPQPQQQLPPPPVQPPLPTSEAVSVPTSSTHDLSSELDSFYSDLATLEPEEPAPPPPPPTPLDLPLPPPPLPDTQSESTLEKAKKKKKTKLAPGLSLKKKGVSSLVAKWQQVQEDVRRDMKHD